MAPDFQYPPIVLISDGFEEHEAQLCSKLIIYPLTIKTWFSTRIIINPFSGFLNHHFWSLQCLVWWKTSPPSILIFSLQPKIGWKWKQSSIDTRVSQFHDLEKTEGEAQGMRFCDMERPVPAHVEYPSSNSKAKCSLNSRQ